MNKKNINEETTPRGRNNEWRYEKGLWHFITRLLRFINKTTAEYEQDLTKEECIKTRPSIKERIHCLIIPPSQKGICSGIENFEHILPESWSKSLPYDVKANPDKYLVYSFNMNSILEARGYKLFQPLSLRNTIIPHYINLDTASLINLFCSKRW